MLAIARIHHMRDDDDDDTLARDKINNKMAETITAEVVDILFILGVQCTNWDYDVQGHEECARD